MAVGGGGQIDFSSLFVFFFHIFLSQNSQKNVIVFENGKFFPTIEAFGMLQGYKMSFSGPVTKQ